MTPAPEASLDQPPIPSVPSLSTSLLSRGQPSVASRICQLFRTPRNIFGLFRQYHSEQLPSHDPEEHVDLQDLFDDSETAGCAPSQSQSSNPFYPYPNQNSFLLGDWNWNHGIQKSRNSFSELLSIIGSPDFNPGDVRHTRWAKIDAELGRNNFDGVSSAAEEGEWEDEDAGWHRTPIEISVPFHSRAENTGAKNFIVGDLYHRTFVSVIREKLADPYDNQHFHYEPFQVFWNPTDESDDIQVHGELYTSPAFLQAHRELQDSPRVPGCDLPRVVVAMMFASDATHLTSFGTAKLWPGYLFFGNESKYHRCKPTYHLCNHVAYFQAVSDIILILCFGLFSIMFQLPDAFKDFADQNMGANGSIKALMTHCHREVLHAQWSVLLDDEFIDAYQHGIVIKCCDGIMRRFYPRILTYSADYPEK
jgi:hypothetical protein